MTRSAVSVLCISIFGALAWAQAPSAEEQARYLDEARTAALAYADSLPDFMCSEIVHRSVGDSGRWRSLDNLNIQLTYFNKKENYKIVLANGKSTDPSDESNPGALTKGQFGGALHWIFDPSSATVFRWEKALVVRKMPVTVYSYRIARAHSQYALGFGSGVDAKGIEVGFHGTLDIANQTKTAMRLTLEADDIPADFPIRQSTMTVDYGFADVGGRQYLLPAQAETTMLYQPNRSTQKGPIRVLRPTQWRNLVDFRAYRKFAVDSVVQFGDDGKP